MRNSTANAQSNAVPLARDEDGNPIDIPTDASFWRVRRHTRGRPRNVPGVDREPLKLPLDFTEEDLHGMLGPGTYRLDLYDQAGEPLDLTVAVTVGDPEPANANQTRVAEPQEVSPLLPASASDTRLVLEANVRATQMAFQHNERTLAASLRMAETLRDGVRSLAEAQADWIKSISSARGFFRNARHLPPVVEEAREDEADEENEEDEEVADAPSTGLEKAIAMVEPFIPELMANWRKKSRPEDDGAKAMVHLARIRSRLTHDEREILDAALADPDTGEAVADDLRGKTVDGAIAAIRRSRRTAPRDPASNGSAVNAIEDPALMQKVVAVSALLEPAERLRLLRLGPRVTKSPDAMELIARLVPLSDEAAADWLRAHLDELEARFAS